MRLQNRTLCSVACLVLLLAFGFTRPASAATISIGSVWFGPLTVLHEDPQFGLTYYIGAQGGVTNASPVAFNDLVLLVSFYSSSAQLPDWGCGPFTLAPGGQESCSTGPLERAPQVLWGISIAGSVSGSLSSTSFLLSDGSTFVAHSNTFGVSVADTFFQGDSGWDLSRQILIDGHIFPATTPTAVPETSSTAMLLAGALMVSWSLARRL